MRTLLVKEGKEARKEKEASLFLSVPNESPRVKQAEPDAW
jgi:hypothetical protein